MAKQKVISLNGDPRPISDAVVNDAISEAKADSNLQELYFQHDNLMVIQQIMDGELGFLKSKETQIIFNRSLEKTFLQKIFLSYRDENRQECKELIWQRQK